MAVGSPAGLASPSATAPAAPKPSKPPPRAAIAPGGSGSSAGSLLAAADAAVSLLLWPVSIAQAVLGVGGRRAAAAGPLASPAAAGALAGHGTPGSSGGRGVRYGLGWGEAESEDEGEEGGESELTAAALRRLQASPEFRCYLQVGGGALGWASKGWACVHADAAWVQPQPALLHCAARAQAEPPLAPPGLTARAFPAVPPACRRAG